jgi:CRISPR/Cas system CMR subunit Cmr4 (Cas7 group RAMP superfamily)
VTLEEVAEAMGEELLAPGVYGNRFDTAQGIYIPVITAVHPGSGEVSRFLDNLPRDRTIKFPTVLSGRLRGMLLRRGFRDGEEFAPEFGETVQIMVRNAEVKPCP